MTTVNELNKTAKSIRAAIDRGETMNGKRLQGLVDRYDDLKSDLTENGRWKDWAAYCEANQFDNSHNGHDLIA